MKKGFEGYYFKHQKGDNTLCLILGRTANSQFIQIVTNNTSYHLPSIGKNRFSPRGIYLNIQTPQLFLVGKIRYEKLSPIAYDIMGPFQYFPMECRHGIISMMHTLNGSVTLNGQILDFTGGKGYIETDSGTSFPKSYLWIQSNDFPKSCSVMVSVADIPFFGVHFRGCIAIVQYKGKEYRFATYLGVQVKACTKHQVILKQGKYRLEVRIHACAGHQLAAPKNGEMSRTIIETVACPANFKFYIHDKVIFDMDSPHTSFEYEAQ